MTTRKLLLLVGGIVGGLILIVVIFVGAIMGIVFYSLSHSEAASTAKDFLRNNAKLKQEIGEVKDFGSFITGSINTQNTDGDATINLKVIGEKRTVNASVDLSYRSNRAWRVTGASFDDKGRRVELLEKFESAPTSDAP